MLVFGQGNISAHLQNHFQLRAGCKFVKESFLDFNCSTSDFAEHVCLFTSRRSRSISHFQFIKKLHLAQKRIQDESIHHVIMLSSVAAVSASTRYGVEKRIEERLWLDWAMSTGIQVTVLRLPNVVGQRLVSSNHTGLLGEVINSVLEKRIFYVTPVFYQTRSFMTVAKLCRLIFEELQTNKLANNSFVNFHQSTTLYVFDLILWFQDTFNLQVEFVQRQGSSDDIINGSVLPIPVKNTEIETEIIFDFDCGEIASLVSELSETGARAF